MMKFSYFCFRYRTRSTRTPFLETIRTRYVYAAFPSTFRPRTQIFKINQYPFQTRTTNPKINPFRFRLRIWVRVRNVYGIRTLTPDSRVTRNEFFL